MSDSKEKKGNWFMRHKVITGIIVLVVFIAIASSSGSSSDQSGQSSTTSNNAQQEQVQETTYEVVTTASFIEDFDTNQLSAEKKYKGKGVQLTAQIKNISEDIMGSPYLSLEPTNAGDFYVGTTIQCFFENEDALLNASNGQTITIKGIVDEQSLGIIGIKKCQIVE